MNNTDILKKIQSMEHCYQNKINYENYTREELTSEIYKNILDFIDNSEYSIRLKKYYFDNNDNISMNIFEELVSANFYFDSKVFGSVMYKAPKEILEHIVSRDNFYNLNNDSVAMTKLLLRNGAIITDKIDKDIENEKKYRKNEVNRNKRNNIDNNQIYVHVDILKKIHKLVKNNLHHEFMSVHK